MKMKIQNRNLGSFIVLIAMCCCQPNRDQQQFQTELQSLNLSRGEIALCGSADGQFGKVEFALSCREKVRGDFNLATALLHSFEYAEAEKVFARVIDEDPDCLMAYWGVAMSNFHPLWSPPTKEELEKGLKTITLARSLESSEVKESAYLEAVGAFYDDWSNVSHQERMLRFEKAAEGIYQKYPDDKEAAVFYSLALRASSDPTDKSFAKQRKAGDILNQLFPNEPDHPGIAHYLIHTYDYPELAELALPAARKYAAIAATSAHALHMPSHIFTRLGLWDESIESNMNSIAAAKCYAENAGIKGHWDEELHGIDYLVYAYLQEGRDSIARAELDYLRSIQVVFPVTNKNAYTFAAVPTRFALERKEWVEASQLEPKPADFPWEKFPWERSIISFGRALGNARLHKPDAAKKDIADLQENYTSLVTLNKTYEANQVQIQIRAIEGWIAFEKGNRENGLTRMAEAAAMEEATEKHPVTPGEVIPARELYGDMLMEAGQFKKALEAYETDIKRHPGRLNGLYGAALAAHRSGDKDKADRYYKQLVALTQRADIKRKTLADAGVLMNRKRGI